MKSKRNTFFKAISTKLIVFAIFCTTNLNALQGGPPPGQTGTDIDSLPLDGGLIALLIGAVAFGVKKLYSNKNDKA